MIIRKGAGQVQRKKLTIYVDPRVIEEIKIESIKTNKSIGQQLEEMWAERKMKKEKDLKK